MTNNFVLRADLSSCLGKSCYLCESVFPGFRCQNGGVQIVKEADLELAHIAIDNCPVGCLFLIKLNKSGEEI